MGNVPLQNREDIRPQIEQAVADFCRAIGYPSDRISSKGPHYRYDYADDPEKSEVQFPHAEEPGCYVFANDSGEILYVGKGSRYMGSRIWAPFGRQGKDGEVQAFPDAKPWVMEHRPGVWAIAVPKEHWWLAAAFEGFLIERFKPPDRKSVV